MGAVLAAALTPLPAQAAGPSYVALGDSFSAGVGTRTYLQDGTSCQRSAKAYPSLIAARRGYELTLRACSGATTGDVRSRQLSALGPNTRYVTITIGGNNAGYADVLTTCAQPAWMSNCHARIDTAQAYVRDVMPGDLNSLFADILARAPQARVVVVGYPRLFNGTDCNPLTWFSAGEMARLNETGDQLNAVASRAAASAGVGYVDPTSRFSGHAVCDRPEWVNGLSVPVSESFHPNRDGHAAGYLPLVEPAVTGGSGQQASLASVSLASGPGTAAAGTPAQTARIAANARRFASQDRGQRPERVQPVDLHSAQARRAAQAAGVDVDDRASVDAADARYSEIQDAAAMSGS